MNDTLANSRHFFWHYTNCLHCRWIIDALLNIINWIKWQFSACAITQIIRNCFDIRGYAQLVLSTPCPNHTTPRVYLAQTNPSGLVFLNQYIARLDWHRRCDRDFIICHAWTNNPHEIEFSQSCTTCCLVTSWLIFLEWNFRLAWLCIPCMVIPVEIWIEMFDIMWPSKGFSEFWSSHTVSKWWCEKTQNQRTSDSTRMRSRLWWHSSKFYLGWTVPSMNRL